MSKGRNHSEDFERYLKGQMSPEEAHAFEREVLDDPFAQEALEGFEAIGNEAFEDVEGLKRRINQKSETKKFPFYKLAIAASILIIGSFTLYFTINQLDSTSELAMEKESGQFEESSTEPELLEKEIPSESDAEIETSESVDKIEESMPMEQLAEDVNEKSEVEAEQELEATQEDFYLAKTEVVEEVSDVEFQDESKEVKAIAAKSQITTIDRSRISLDSINLDAIDISPKALVASSPQELDSNVATLLQGRAAGIAIENAPRKATNDDSSSAQPILIRGTSTISKKKSSDNSATISGLVTDESGEPIPGVNVIIKGTTSGTQTDLDGSYMLPKLNDMTLVFSFVGFETNEVEVGSRTQIDMTLGGTTELQEVVVTGYGANEEVSPSYISAKPIDGNKSYKKYLESNLIYPEEAIQNKVEGTIILQLTISSEGMISNIEVKKSLGFGCDEEAIRLVREGPKWKAAEQNGNQVEDKTRVKVKFKLK